jgi:hypothetical protein
MTRSCARDKRACAERLLVFVTLAHTAQVQTGLHAIMQERMEGRFQNRSQISSRKVSNRTCTLPPSSVEKLHCTFPHNRASSELAVGIASILILPSYVSLDGIIPKIKQVREV